MSEKISWSRVAEFLEIKAFPEEDVTPMMSQFKRYWTRVEEMTIYDDANEENFFRGLAFLERIFRSVKCNFYKLFCLWKDFFSIENNSSLQYVTIFVAYLNTL